LKRLVGDTNLYLVEAPALKPAEIMMDPLHIEQLNADLIEAAQSNLPDDEDEEFKWEVQLCKFVSYLCMVCYALYVVNKL